MNRIAKVVLFSRMHKYITTESAKVSEMTRGNPSFFKIAIFFP